MITAIIFVFCHFILVSFVETVISLILFYFSIFLWLIFFISLYENASKPIILVLVLILVFNNNPEELLWSEIQ